MVACFTAVCRAGRCDFDVSAHPSQFAETVKPRHKNAHSEEHFEEPNWHAYLIYFDACVSIYVLFILFHVLLIYTSMSHWVRQLYFHWYSVSILTAHNWQKWNRVFLTCPCHVIYRDEAVGLKSCKYTWKITIFVKMWNLGQYHENSIFCQYLLNWSSNLKILLHKCDKYYCYYLKNSTFRFNLIDFQLNTDFPSQFCVFLP